MSTVIQQPPACQHCGLYHSTTCPRIRAIEYHDNGNIKRIEFHELGGAAPGSFDFILTIRKLAEDLAHERKKEGAG